MSEFKGSKGNIKKDENLIFVDNYFQTHICKLVNVYNDEVTQANAELIVEAFDIRQQIPFSLTELKRQRDELLTALEDALQILYECDPPKHLNETYANAYANYHKLIQEATETN